MINAGYDEKKLLETAEVKASLLSDFILFTQTFYKLRTGREFRLLPPIGRENHCLTIAKGAPPTVLIKYEFVQSVGSFLLSIGNSCRRQREDRPLIAFTTR